MKKKLISVIVPIYGVEDYLGRCVDSIINQTYSNLEIILVDDGSPDKCGEICDDYKQKDSRIVVIHKPNGGLSDARNKGLEVATGEYVMFIDSDDYIHPKMVEVLYINLIKEQADMSYCKYRNVSNSAICDVDFEKEQIQIFDKFACFNNLYNNLYVATEVACNKLYKKELWKDLRYPLGKLHEDEFVIHYLIEKCKKIVFSNLELYFYYDRPGSITKKYNIKRLDSILAFEDRMNFFKAKGYKDLYTKSAIAYLKVIGFNYISIKKELKDKELEEKIKNDFYTAYKKISFEIKLSFKDKIQLFMVIKMPSFYTLLKKILRGG